MSYRALGWAWDQPLKSAPKILLVSLADQANDDGIAYPGKARLVKRTGLSKSSIKKYLGHLRSLGLISVFHQWNPEKGLNERNRYLLHLEVEASISMADPKDKTVLLSKGEVVSGENGGGVSPAPGVGRQTPQVGQDAPQGGATHGPKPPEEPPDSHFSAQRAPAREHPDTEVPTTPQEWTQVFMDRFGYPRDRAMQPKALQMFREWGAHGVRVGLVADAVSGAEARGVIQPVPTYFRGPVEELAAEASRPAPQPQRPSPPTQKTGGYKPPADPSRQRWGGDL